MDKNLFRLSIINEATNIKVAHNYRPEYYNRSIHFLEEVDNKLTNETIKLYRKELLESMVIDSEYESLVTNTLMEASNHIDNLYSSFYGYALQNNIPKEFIKDNSKYRLDILNTLQETKINGFMNDYDCKICDIIDEYEDDLFKLSSNIKNTINDKIISVASNKFGKICGCEPYKSPKELFSAVQESVIFYSTLLEELTTYIDESSTKSINTLLTPINKELLNMKANNKFIRNLPPKTELRIINKKIAALEKDYNKLNDVYMKYKKQTNEEKKADMKRYNSYIKKLTLSLNILCKGIIGVLIFNTTPPYEYDENDIDVICRKNLTIYKEVITKLKSREKELTKILEGK